MKSSFLVGLISYLIGNFSSAYVLGKVFRNKDVREYGSKNAGATNALRVFGKGIGAFAFVLDVLKALIAVFIGGKLLGYNGKLIAGVFVVVGHNYPVFLRFKGGKGIASSIGVLLSLHWPTAIVCIVIGILIIIKFRYVSLGSISAACLVPLVGSIMNRPFDKRYFVTTLILAIMAIYRHRTNIKRLIDGKEFKIGERV